MPLVPLLHDAVQDLTILHRAVDVYPRNIFDTRFAAGFCGYPSILSLVALVGEICGVELDKAEQRTNWIRRPLSAEQIAYALSDVRYLHTVRDTLMAKIAGTPRADWLAADLADLDNPSHYNEQDSLNRLYRVKGVGKVGRRDLGVLFELIDWREKRARVKNLPREFVIPEKVLLEIARIKPLDKNGSVHPFDGFTPRWASMYGDELGAAVLRGEAKTNAELPEARGHGDEYYLDTEEVNKAATRIRELAEQAGIDAVVIAPRASLCAFLRDDPVRRATSPLMRGWRYDQFGKKIETEKPVSPQVSLDL